jgi:hypothetical protein
MCEFVQNGNIIITLLHYFFFLYKISLFLFRKNKHPVVQLCCVCIMTAENFLCQHLFLQLISSFHSLHDVQVVVVVEHTMPMLPHLVR